MLKFLDVLLFWTHIVVTIFNLIGWIWAKTRKVHLIVMSITIFSWLFLGIWYGFGYCFLTHWHWEIKYELGQRDLPYSFIKYFLDRHTGLDIPAATVDIITLLCFLGAIGATVYVNFIRKKN